MLNLKHYIDREIMNCKAGCQYLFQEGHIWSEDPGILPEPQRKTGSSLRILDESHIRMNFWSGLLYENIEK